jgi:hypothetical protein
VNASSLRPGLGTRMVLEQATGALEWQRVEAGVHLLQSRGHLTLAMRMDGGVVRSDAPPPQTLYELGTTTGLSSHGYKAFAGDRAILARLGIVYEPGLLRTPIRLRSIILPAPAPAPAMRWQAGWTEASDAALPVIESLGSRESDGLRSAVAIQLQIFGGMLGFGAERPLDRGGRWKPVVTIAGGL